MIGPCCADLTDVMRPAITLTHDGPVLDLNDSSLGRLRADWLARHCVVLERFLDPRLVAAVRRQIASGTFGAFVHEESGHEAKMDDNAAVWLLDFLMNGPELLQAIGRVTDRPVTWFHGRVYRLTPGTDEGHDWHKDYEIGRQIGVSVNLTEGAFAGGVLQLRDAVTKVTLSEVANTGSGDGVIFRLGDDVQHRVLPVTGHVARLAFAGWFYTGPTLRERLVHRLDFRGQWLNARTQRASMRAARHGGTGAPAPTPRPWRRDPDHRSANPRCRCRGRR